MVRAMRARCSAECGPAAEVSPDTPRAALAAAREGQTAAPVIRDRPESRLVPGGAFVLDAPSTPPALWGHGQEVAWAAGEALMLVGPSGVGKSTVATQLVAGRLGIVPDVLGLTVVPGRRRVLYLAMDRPPQIARAMARLFLPEHRRLLDERLIVWPGPPPQDLARQPELLTAMCAEANADTVVVDSLKDAVRKLSDDESGGGYNTARQRALVAGVQVVELHHQRKAGAENKKPSALDDVYGSTWLTAGAGSVVLLWGTAGDPVVELLHLKQPAEEIGPWQVYHDHSTGISEVRHRADLLALAAHLSSRGGLTPKAAASALFGADKPTPSEVEKARRRLNKLAHEGHLVRHGGARGGADGGAPVNYFPAIREAS